MSELLVVAGEASGDRAAAAVVAELMSGFVRAPFGVRSPAPRYASPYARMPSNELPSRAALRVFGMGGAALEAGGVELLADLRKTTALGVGEALVRGGSVLRAFAVLSYAAKQHAPDAALLVNYTEFNAQLAPILHAIGTRVLWYGAPQIWAWRAGRAKSLRRHVDRMAVILPFEEALWRGHGVDAHYVGHPSRETTALDRATARRALGLTPLAKAVAILPGSRPHEVDRLLVPMLRAYDKVRRDRASVDGRVLLAASLDPKTRARALKAAAELHVGVFDVDAYAGASAVLPAFDASLCASGTAALEAALARAIPVIAYKVGLTTEIAARLFVDAPHVALPNILLGRAAFEELLQRDAREDRLAKALARALDRKKELTQACEEVEASLGASKSPSKAVAQMLAPWLGLTASEVSSPMDRAAQ